MTNTDEYAKARRRAKAKYNFFVHAAVYAAVMVLLVLVNVLTLPGPIWFIWPLIGWGFAVALHGAQVYLLADKTLVLDALTDSELRKISERKKD
mgnify:CR=1 FL=1